LRIATFDAGVMGGSLFRIGIGATAFLMPLMLQLGFGLDPLSSGLITFAGAVGALFMKSLAPVLIRRIGFRSILIWNGLLASAAIAATGLFAPGTPAIAMSAVLLAGGLLRSLQFSSLHAITYADVESERTSAATSLASVAQQLSLSFGVAIGAGVLEISAALADRTLPAPADYSSALLTVAALSALAVLWMLPLSEDAGASMRGSSREGRDDG